jgi:hypothetical protein
MRGYFGVRLFFRGAWGLINNNFLGGQEFSALVNM